MTIIAFHDHAVKAELAARSRTPGTLSLAGETRMYSVSFPGIGRCEHCGAYARGHRVGSPAHAPTLICRACIDVLARAQTPALGICACCGRYGPGRCIAQQVVCLACRAGLLAASPVRRGVEGARAPA